MTKDRLIVIGAGRLATALLPTLVGSGWVVDGLVSPEGRSARKLARLIDGGPGLAAAPLPDRAGTIWLIAVPDRKILEVAESLARAGGEWSRQVVLHAAGALGPEVLAALRRRGAACGVFHPLQCLGDGRLSAMVLPGSYVRIEGPPRAERAGRRLARTLGMTPWRLPDPTPSRRAAYHAAASLVANDLAALFTVAASILERQGLRPSDVRRGLARLAEGTRLHLERGRPGSALTGPAARGDLSTLDKQQAVLARISADAAEAHRALSRVLADTARHGKWPPSATRRKMGRSGGSE